MEQFRVTDHVKMKRNLRKIDTYGISPCILKKHKNTIFTIRKIHEDETGQYALRMYSCCKVYNILTGKFEPYESEFYLAYWNPAMFEKIGEVENGKKSFIKRRFFR